jgi:hypothetical protein
MTKLRGAAQFAAFLALLAAAVSPSRASTIFTNIQPGDVFFVGVGIGLIPGDVFNYAGVGFTPDQTYSFDSAELAVSLNSGPNVLNVYLMGNADGIPSGVIESFHLVNDLSSDPATGLITVDSTTHPLLDAGMQYWIVAAGGAKTFASWQENVHNDMGPNASGPTLTTLIRDSDSNVIEALEVDGTSAVPEPESGMLTAAALILLCILARASALLNVTRESPGS